MTTNQWDQPLISVDVVPVKLDKLTGDLKVFVAKRQYDPYLGDYALPGVLLSATERVSEAANRALEEKTLIPNESVRAVKDVGVSDNPDRDPRGATLAIVNLAVIDNDYEPSDDAVKALSVSEALELGLPFDHANLIRKALIQLESLLMSDKAISRALLGDEFRTTDLYNSYSKLSEVVSSNTVVPDLSNLSRRLKSTRGITSLSTESTVDTLSISSATGSTGRGRPSSLWSWDENQD